MIRKFLFLFVVLFSFFSCQEKKSNSQYTWIGGEIVNPKSDYIVLLKGNEILDSVQLNSKNKFLYKIKDLKEGLYSFMHKEFQVFYLEPNDSLLLRVNIIDFDESLFYSGKGAEKNNFLMDLFLQNEIDIDLMPQLYNRTPQEFEKALDSLKDIRINLYSEFKTKTQPSKGFREVAKANIDYDYYSKKEIYSSIYNRKNNFQKQEAIPKSFYNYRKKIDFGNESLRSYFPYYRFLFRYFDNLAFSKNKNNSNSQRNSLEHNYLKIQLIDSLITNDSLKNNMIKSVAERYLLNCNDEEKQKKMLALFLNTNTNPTHKKQLKELTSTSLKITSGNKIPNISLLNFENKKTTIKDIIKRPTVFYFWSGKNFNNYKNIIEKIDDLQKKIPKYDFIGINTDTNFNTWKQLVSASGYNLHKEYLFDNSSNTEKQLITYVINKAIIVDKKGVIMDGSINLFNPVTEKKLMGYLTK